MCGDLAFLGSGPFRHGRLQPRTGAVMAAEQTWFVMHAGLLPMRMDVTVGAQSETTTPPNWHLGLILTFCGLYA